MTLEMFSLFAWNTFAFVVNEAVDEHLNGLLFVQLADAAVVTYYGLRGATGASARDERIRARISSLAEDISCSP